MAEIRPNYKVTVTATMELSEMEMRALYGLTAYGTEVFLKAFYKNLGRNQLEPYEGGLRTLFDKIRMEIGPAISDVDDARRALKEKREAARKRLEERLERRG